MRVLLLLVFLLVVLVVTPVLAQGRELARFADVPAYSNEANTATEVGEWQCVEFVKRYLDSREVAWVSVGSARRVCELAESGMFPGLVFYPNRGSEAPQVGDVLGFSGGKNGHVAVVYEVGELWLKVIEQNWRRDSAVHQVAYAKRGNVYVVESRGEYVCQGWCRVQTVKPAGVATKPVSNSVRAPEKQSVRYRVLLLDASVAMAKDRLWEGGRREVASQIATFGEGEQGSVVCFANYAWVVARPQFKENLAGEVEQTLKLYTPTGEANLESGVRVALRQIPKDAQGRIVLITAGGEIAGDFAPVVQQCKERDIPIDVHVLSKTSVSHWRNIARVTGGSYAAP